MEGFSAAVMELPSMKWVAESRLQPAVSQLHPFSLFCNPDGRLLLEVRSLALDVRRDARMRLSAKIARAHSYFLSEFWGSPRGSLKGARSLGVGVRVLARTVSCSRCYHPDPKDIQSSSLPAPRFRHPIQISPALSDFRPGSNVVPM